MHSHELTLYPEIHVTVMTSYQALVMHDLINSATVNQRAANVFNLWAIPYTNPTPPQNKIKYKSVMNVSIKLKISNFSRETMLLFDSQENPNQYTT